MGSSASCTFSLQSGTADVYVNTDFYPSEGGMTIVSPTGVTTTYSWGGDGTVATLTELSTASTPATSPAGTTLDNDDDGDNVLDANENTGCSLLADCDGDGDNDDTDQFPLNSAEWDDTDGDAPAGSDGTGWGDNSDAFPTDACANVDTDGDGFPDDIVDGCTTTLTEDIDDDGDGILDDYDSHPPVSYTHLTLPTICSV